MWKSTENAQIEGAILSSSNTNLLQEANKQVPRGLSPIML